MTEARSPGDVAWSILGPLTATADAPFDLGGLPQRILLALLLSRGGETVSMSAVVETMWGAHPPRTAVNIVHRHVGALRRLVEADLPRRAQGRFLLPDGAGYRVEVGADSLDLLSFREAVLKAEHTHDPHLRLDQLCSALSLWRGPVVDDLAAHLTGDPVLEHITRQHAEVVLGGAELALSLGCPDRLLPALRLAVRMNPTDELLHAALVRCLAGSGQRAAALDRFESLRVVLSEDFGVSPGPELRRAHLDVLRDRVEPARRRRMPTPRQLPADLGVFVGRAEQVEQLVDALMGDASTCLITGTAGVGKTTLAVHVAHAVADSFPDGQLYVDLQGFDEGAALTTFDVLGRFLVALDIPAEGLPDTEEARVALYRSTIADRRILVVLDNARDTAQVRPLLPAGPAGALVTSRRQLRGLTTSGATTVPLDLFTAAEADTFLRGRLPGERIEVEVDSFGELIRLSGLLPLSLSLLAARAAHSPSTSLRDVVVTVRDSTSPLAPLVDRAEANRDARSVLSWSYRSLSEPAARLFVLMSMYPGPAIRVSAAAALAGVDATTVRDHLDELVESNIVQYLPSGRVGRHDLLRLYSSELLAATDPMVRSEAERRLWSHVTREAVAAAIAYNPGRHSLAEISPPADLSTTMTTRADREAAVGWFESEYEAIRSLLRTGREADRDHAQVWQLAWALDNFMDGRGLWHDALDLHHRGLAAAQQAGDLTAAAAMRRSSARANMHLGNFDAAQQQLHDVLGSVEGVENIAAGTRSETHRMLSWIADLQGRADASLVEAQEALAAHPADSRENTRALALSAVGLREAQLGHLDAASHHCLEALEILAGTEHVYGWADASNTLGLIYARQGRDRLAVRAYRKALEGYSHLEVTYLQAGVAAELGHVLLHAGRGAWARRLLEHAHELFADLGHARAAQVAAELADLQQQQ